MTESEWKNRRTCYHFYSTHSSYGQNIKRNWNYHFLFLSFSPSLPIWISRNIFLLCFYCERGRRPVHIWAQTRSLSSPPKPKNSFENQNYQILIPIINSKSNQRSFKNQNCRILIHVSIKNRIKDHWKSNLIKMIKYSNHVIKE